MTTPVAPGHRSPTAPATAPATALRAGGARYLPWTSWSGAVQCAATVPGARTLVEIFAVAVARFPDAAALDDGRQVLSYRALDAQVRVLAGRLAAIGLGRGDRVGLRLPSGHAHLYVAILAVLHLGAAYVPVDHDDPSSHPELVFDDAEVTAILADGRILPGPGHRTGSTAATDTADETGPRGGDDAWILFSSGSTRPEGVAVTHAAAAAVVDGQAALLADRATGRPALGPGDRVLAGLPGARNPSWAEMWLAWRHGACLVPAPRDLARAGVELGDWLPTRRITAVSTVPTLAGLWTRRQLATVRLLILGGEPCPELLATRLARSCQRVWNTYRAAETSLVATGARLRPGAPVRIGRPLPGFQVAVVDPAGEPVRAGELGELVIGGISLGRFLDPARDAARYQALPALGWDRAYCSGDRVRADPRGLIFDGPLDDQRGMGEVPRSVRRGGASPADLATTAAW